MVDKPIMTNGVDVSDCEYLGLDKECKVKGGSYCTFDCSDNPKCYYKELIRIFNIYGKLDKIAHRLSVRKFPNNQQIEYDCYGCCGCCATASNYMIKIANQLKEVIKELKG